MIKIHGHFIKYYKIVIFYEMTMAIIYFYFQKAKNKPTKSTYICEMIFTFVFFKLTCINNYKWFDENTLWSH